MNRHVPGWSTLPELNDVIKQEMEEQDFNKYIDHNNESVVSKPLDFWDKLLIVIAG